MSSSVDHRYPNERSDVSLSISVVVSDCSYLIKLHQKKANPSESTDQRVFSSGMTSQVRLKVTVSKKFSSNWKVTKFAQLSLCQNNFLVGEKMSKHSFSWKMLCFGCSSALLRNKLRSLKTPYLVRAFTRPESRHCYVTSCCLFPVQPRNMAPVNLACAPIPL